MLANEDRDLRKRAGKKRGSEMSDAVYAQDLLHEAYPGLMMKGRGQVKDALWRAYTFMKPIVEERTGRTFTIRRVRTIQSQASLIRAAEMEALKLAIIKEAFHEQQKLRARLEVLDERVALFNARLAEQEMAD